MVLNLRQVVTPAMERHLRRTLEAGTPHYGRQQARRRGINAYDVDSNAPASRTLAERVVRWLAPFDARYYPGRARLVLAALGAAALYNTVCRWCRGDRALPAWAARAWSQAIRWRCEEGLALADALDAHAADRDARPKPGDRFRAMRAAGVAPAGLGARGRMRPADPDDPP